MKFRVERDVFAEAVAWAARSLPVRPPVPVLAGLLLEVSDSPAGLALSSFDYEVSANAQIDVTAAEAGRALVSGRLLAEISRSLPAQPVDVSVEGTRVVVSCGSARFTMPTLPVDDYPALPEMPTTAGTIGADVFAAAVSQVAIAAGRDDTLPVLTGVRIEIEDDRVTLGRDRSLPPRGSRAALAARACRPVDRRFGAGPHARRYGEGTRRWRPSHRVAVDRRIGRRSHRLLWPRRRSPDRASGGRRRGCSTANT